MLDAFTARIEQLRAGRQSFCHALQDRFVDIAQDPTEGAFRTLRLELALLARGKREYVQVLRLLESFRLAEVEAAIGDALKLGAIGFDAVKHLVLCRIERRPPRLDLDVYPYLPKARVATTSARSYMSLLPGAGT